MDGPRAKLLESIFREPPMTLSGKEKGELHRHTFDGQNQLILPMQQYPEGIAKGFSNCVLHQCSVPSMKTVLLLNV